MLRVVDGLGRGAQHRDAGVLEPLRQAQRGLPAERADDPGHRPGRALGLDHLEDVLEGERLEVEPVGGVVVGGDGLGVAVDHHRLVAGVLQSHDRVHAGVVELDALPDPVGPGAQDQHRLLLPRLHLVLLVVGRVVVRRGGGELGGAGVDGLVDGPDAQPPRSIRTPSSPASSGRARRSAGRRARAACPGAAAPGEGRRVLRISARSRRPARSGRRTTGRNHWPPRPPRPWRRRPAPARRRRAGRRRARGGRRASADRCRPTRPEARDLGLRRPHRLAQRLGEVPAHRHDLADALHRRRQPGSAPGNFSNANRGILTTT